MVLEERKYEFRSTEYTRLLVFIRGGFWRE